MNITLVLVVIFGIGALVALAGHIWFLVKGFQESALWGICLFLLGLPVGILFLIFHWNEGRKPFATTLIGMVLMVGPLVAVAIKHDKLKQFGVEEVAGIPGAPVERGESERNETKLPEGDLMEAREAVMNLESVVAAETAKLQQAHAQLQAINAKLNPKDQAAVTAYNRQVETYSGQKIGLDGKRARLAAMRIELEKRIDASPGGAARGGGSGGGVVIYTTKTCPYCVTAKKYFSSRNIPFTEMDVNSSAVARAAYEKLNARGVPVIVIKGEVIHGFNEARIAQLL